MVDAATIVALPKRAFLKITVKNTTTDDWSDALLPMFVDAKKVSLMNCPPTSNGLAFNLYDSDGNAIPFYTPMEFGASSGLSSPYYWDFYIKDTLAASTQKSYYLRCFDPETESPVRADPNDLFDVYLPCESLSEFNYYYRAYVNSSYHLAGSNAIRYNDTNYATSHFTYKSITVAQRMLLILHYFHDQFQSGWYFEENSGSYGPRVMYGNGTSQSYAGEYVMAYYSGSFHVIDTYYADKRYHTMAILWDTSVQKFKYWHEGKVVSDIPFHSTMNPGASYRWRVGTYCTGRVCNNYDLADEMYAVAVPYSTFPEIETMVYIYPDFSVLRRPFSTM